jgi:hypothetical protein
LSRSYPQALEKSESDRASLEKELRMLQGADGAPRAAAGSYPGDSRALDLQDSSLPVFNTRTDDTGLVALAALGCFSLAGVVMYLQHALGGNGIGGAIGGALVVGSGLIGFVLSVVVLFKFFLYLFGANSDDVLKVRNLFSCGARCRALTQGLVVCRRCVAQGKAGYVPINSEPGPVTDRYRKVAPDAARCPTLESIPRPDSATLTFLTTGQQYVASDASKQPYQVCIRAR